MYGVAAFAFRSDRDLLQRVNSHPVADTYLIQRQQDASIRMRMDHKIQDLDLKLSVPFRSSEISMEIHCIQIQWSQGPLPDSKNVQ